MVFDFSLGVSWRLILRRINLYARMALSHSKKGGTPKIGGYNHPIYSLNPYILTATRPTGFLQHKCPRKGRLECCAATFLRWLAARCTASPSSKEPPVSNPIPSYAQWVWVYLPTFLRVKVKGVNAPIL